MLRANVGVFLNACHIIVISLHASALCRLALLACHGGTLILFMDTLPSPPHLCPPLSCPVLDLDSSVIFHITRLRIHQGCVTMKKIQVFHIKL